MPNTVRINVAGTGTTSVTDLLDHLRTVQTGCRHLSLSIVADEFTAIPWPDTKLPATPTLGYMLILAGPGTGVVVLQYQNPTVDPEPLLTADLTAGERLMILVPRLVADGSAAPTYAATEGLIYGITCDSDLEPVDVYFF